MELEPIVAEIGEDERSLKKEEKGFCLGRRRRSEKGKNASTRGSSPGHQRNWTWGNIPNNIKVAITSSHLHRGMRATPLVRRRLEEKKCTKTLARKMGGAPSP